jgi:rhodanese-related sulfurtransferase
LKGRLEWGEPGLTIMDVRSREAFNYERITGAIPMPMDSLPSSPDNSNLEARRDIYVYGDSDQETAQAANRLRDAGFINVAEVKGALPAWKAIGGPTEGIVSMEGPAGPSSLKKSETNVAARLDEKAELASKK